MKLPFIIPAKDWSLSAPLAGFIATSLTYAGPLVILFQVAEAANLSSTQLASWIWGISIGAGLLSLSFSLKYKMPMLFAWNAPGSAMLVTLAPGVEFSQIIGAYCMSGLMMFLLGVSGLFKKIATKVPSSITLGLLAGVLVHFTIALFSQMDQAAALGIGVFVTYIAVKKAFPKYTLIASLFVGTSILMATGDVSLGHIDWQPAFPTWTWPSFSLTAFINISIPLVLVGISGQFLTGIAILQHDGYAPPQNQMVGASGLMSFLLAPTGCHGVNLGAITAAICTGHDAHHDKTKRYIGPIVAAFWYFTVGLFSTALVGIIYAFPAAFISIIAGVALLGTLEKSLSAALSQPSERDAALCTFLISASNLAWLGLSSAFWGLLIGGLILLFNHFYTGRQAP